MWGLIVVYSVLLPFTGGSEVKDITMVASKQECQTLGKRITKETQYNNRNITVSYSCVLIDDIDTN